MSVRESDLKALEEFIVGNAELERLEGLLDSFNIFEAVGMDRQEIRHSQFLAFLLDPDESHGLGDMFLKRFLQSAADDTSSVTPLEISLLDFGGVSIQREWSFTDVFIRDDINRLCVIVENKIGTSEHSNQLERYYDIVREKYPDYRIVAIYLTPDGDDPSHPEYLSLSYGTVCEVLDQVRVGRSAALDSGMSVLMEHYTQMMRRRVVGDSEVARLSQEIYRKHRRAIDVILEHLPDPQDETRPVLVSLVESESNLEVDNVTKTKIRFALKEWDTPALLASEGWTRSKRILLFEFWSYPDYLDLKLMVGPGDQEVKRKLYEMSEKHPHLFTIPSNPEGKFFSIYSRNLAGSVEGEEWTSDVQRTWQDFLENDLPRIVAATRAEGWIYSESGS